MKRLLLIGLLSIGLFADSINIDVGAKSDHLIEGDFNEEHSWKGIGYRFIENDKYCTQIEYANFINSYNDATEFIALTGIYAPFKYKGVRFGISGSIGYQRGYYVNLGVTVHPDRAKRLGIGNESILILYSIYGELDNLVLNYTYIPNSVEAIRVGFKAVEW